MDFKAKDLLDFKPTLFEEALKTTIEWYDKEFVSQYDYRHSFSNGCSRICNLYIDRQTCSTDITHQPNLPVTCQILSIVVLICGSLHRKTNSRAAH